MLADELADTLLDLAALRYPGLLHTAGRDRVERYSFGLALMRALKLDTSQISPGSFRAMGLDRPQDCSLDSTRAETVTGRALSGVRNVLEGFYYEHRS